MPGGKPTTIPTSARICKRRISARGAIAGVGAHQIISITGAVGHAVVKRDIAGVAEVVVHGEQSHVLCPGVAVGAFTIIVALKQDGVLVAPARPGAAAGKLVVEIHRVRPGIVAKFAEIIVVGNDGRGVAGDCG